MEACDILIVGAGAAGMAAAAAVSGPRRVLLADRGAQPGGILLQCAHRGFGGELTGPQYAAELTARLPEHVELLPETTVIEIHPKKVATLSSPRNGLRRIAFQELIFAAGCRERPIGALPIAGTRPNGIYTAGQVQAMINLSRQTPEGPVVILGSGDLGLIVARHLVQAGCTVAALVEQKSVCGGMARNRRACAEAYALPVICSATVAAIHGEDRVSGVTVRRLDGGAEEYIPCRTFITAAGLIPDRQLIRGLGAPEWLHLCGNCRRVHDLVESVAAEGKRAGETAMRRIVQWY